MSSPEDDEVARLTAVHNERTKLAATYMNGVAIAAIAVGRPPHASRPAREHPDGRHPICD